MVKSLQRNLLNNQYLLYGSVLISGSTILFKSPSKCFDFPPLGSTKDDISKFVNKCLLILCPNSIISLVENFIYLNKLVAFDYDIYEYRP